MKRLLSIPLLGLLGLAILFSTEPAYARLSQAEIVDLYAHGKVFFREANETKDLAASRELYQKAALRFERIIQEGEIHNGKLFYNLGNIYFRMNDLGRAILNYRRALDYLPNDPNLIHNLNYARQRRQDRIEEPPQARAWRILFFWHYDLSARTRALIFAGAFCLFWTGAALRLFFRKPFLHGWMVGTAALSLLFLGSLLVERNVQRRTRPGVIIQSEVIARQGDSETYAPSFKEPLHAGAEFKMIERRGDWMLIELADARRCWCPANALALVR